MFFFYCMGTKMKWIIVIVKTIKFTTFYRCLLVVSILLLDFIFVLVMSWCLSDCFLVRFFKSRIIKSFVRECDLLNHLMKKIFSYFFLFKHFSFWSLNEIFAQKLS